MAVVLYEEINVVLSPRAMAVFGITRYIDGTLRPISLNIPPISSNVIPATTDAMTTFSVSICGIISRMTSAAFHGLTAIKMSSASFTAAMLSYVVAGV